MSIQHWEQDEVLALQALARGIGAHRLEKHRLLSRFFREFFLEHPA